MTRHITLIAGSNRPNSQSRRIVEICREALQTHSDTTTEIVDLHSHPLPLWDPDKRTESARWDAVWQPVSEALTRADGFVFVVPEWGGMAPPHVKNLLLLADRFELAHKPALLCGISASLGGAYPISDLRSSGYKNNRILWIPDHLVLRQVGQFHWGDATDNQTLAMQQARVRYSLSMLTAYADALGPIRSTVFDPSFANGM